MLLVDDDDLFLDLTSIELGRLGCEVHGVSDPQDALQVLANRDFDAIITDWQMPGMDGIELVRRVRNAGSADRFRYVVLTTARADPDTAQAALEAGADDVLFKPLDRLQVELTIASINRTVELQRRLHRHNRHLKAAHQRTREAFRRIEADIAAAAQLHRGLLPIPTERDRFDFAWSYIPASNLGGDSIGFVTLRNGATLFFLIDVRGHGVPASLASFHVHHRLVQLAPETPDALERAIVQLNDEMVGQPEDTYCTLICGLLAADGTQAHFVRAGHPQPIIIQGKHARELALSGGFPLGWFAGQTYSAEPVDLAHEATLMVYSDGLTDCLDGDGVPMEVGGLQRVLESGDHDSPVTRINLLENHLRALQPREGFSDDISVLALRRKP
ncbi:PP2C family protein-serine/threonine phosphatase [Novosphingobium sp.]|uniref:PP2C family protein-serine/threonine phosphatase n=1 Tax=Novosphingobium sp. TaxID=1874826 RepID=UPI003BAA528E